MAAGGACPHTDAWQAVESASYRRGVFAGIAQDFRHALSFAGFERDSLPDALEITAETADGVIMGLHTTLSGARREFHPESIASEHGHHCSRTSSTLPASAARGVAHREAAVPSSPAPASPAELADLGPVLRKVAQGETPARPKRPTRSRDHVGGASDVQIGALLMGLRARGETIEEITGAARAMRERAVKVPRRKAPSTLAARRRRQGHAQHLHLCRLVVAGRACQWPSTATGRSPRLGLGRCLKALGIISSAS